MSAENGKSGLPDPPVPADLDLRSFHWMKLNHVALLSSQFNQTTNDLGWRCGVTLWLRGMQQVPASSLPADDLALCQLAGLGRDLRKWKMAKDVALHGFTLHSDGRLYHKVCAETAMSAWRERQRKKDRHKDRLNGGSVVADHHDATALPHGNGGGNVVIGVPVPVPVSIKGISEKEKKVGKEGEKHDPTD